MSLRKGTDEREFLCLPEGGCSPGTIVILMVKATPHSDDSAAIFGFRPICPQPSLSAAYSVVETEMSTGRDMDEGLIVQESAIAAFPRSFLERNAMRLPGPPFGTCPGWGRSGHRSQVLFRAGFPLSLSAEGAHLARQCCRNRLGEENPAMPSDA